MKLLSKINTATKIVILAVYTLILSAIAVMVINASMVVNEAEGYGVKPLDENIQIVTKITESRTHSTSSTNESANWSLYFHIIQRNGNVEISNIEVFAKGKTKSGEDIYFEESNAASTSYKGEICKSGTSFKSFTSLFKKSVSKDNEVTDKELERVFVRVLYSVKKEEVTTKKEIKYYFNVFNQYAEKYNSFDETITLNENNVYQDIANDEVGYYAGQIRVKYGEEKTTSEKKYYDEVYSKFNFNEGKLNESGKSVTNCTITIVGKIKQDEKDTQNVFSNYIKLLELHGSPLDQNSNSVYTKSQISSINSFYGTTNSVNTLFELEELYMFVTITDNNGVTTYHNAKINLPNK